jgi:RNA polymerase sigma factor (sigma-70 family)
MNHPQKRTWADFFNRERARLIGYVRSLIRDAAAQEGEDIVQDVIVRVFDKADITAPIENFSAYVYQALRNRVVDYLRRRRDHDSLDAQLPGDTGLMLSDILADVRFDAADDAERKEINRDLSRAIDTLDEKYQSIFVATEIEGLTFQELSDLWDIPIGTLLARKSRAMQKLRETLLEIDPVHYSALQEKGRYHGKPG